MASMTAADFELFQKFLAFQEMTNGQTDAIAAVAADVTEAAPKTVETAAAPEQRDVTVTIGTTGGFGITATDGTLYSVGRANRESRGKIFSDFKAGDTVTISMIGKYAASVRLAVGAASASETTPQWHCAWSSCSRLFVKDRDGQSYCGHQECPATTQVPEHGPSRTDSPKLASAKATAEKLADTAEKSLRKNATSKPPCEMCQGTAHPHEGMAFLMCLSRQYTRETGLPVRMAVGYGAEFVAFAAWFAENEHRAYAANADGFKLYGGMGAALAAPAVTAPVTVSKAPQTPVAASEGPAKQARGRCTVCRRFVKAGATMHDGCVPTSTAPAVDAAVVAAMSGETVHIDALDDDDEIVAQESVKTPAQMSSADIGMLTGQFNVEISKFKGEKPDGSHSDQENNPQPLIQVRSFETPETFITSAGAGRWVRCANREMWSKLTTRAVGFRFRIELQAGSIISKIGRIPSDVPAAPVETNPQGTVSAAAQKRTATRRARTTAKQAPVKQTIVQTNAPTTADKCKCGRRFNTAGRGQRGLCAHCMPLVTQKAS